jgi:hypothetical protein
MTANTTSPSHDNRNQHRHRHRSLQHLIIDLSSPNYTDTAKVLHNPELSATSYQPRLSTIEVCNVSDSNTLSTQTLVTFDYAVETNGSNVFFMTATLPSVAAATMLESLAAATCPGVKVLDPTTNSTLLQPCMISLSAGTRDDWMAVNCRLTRRASTHCTMYSGTLQFLHTHQCSQQEVLEYTMKALKHSVQQSTFLHTMNAHLLDSSIQVMRVSIYDTMNNDNQGPIVMAAVSHPHDDVIALTGGLTRIAIATLFCIGSMAILLALLGGVWRTRSRVQNQRRRQQQLLVHRPASHDNDGTSHKTEWSETTTSVESQSCCPCWHCWEGW